MTKKHFIELADWLRKPGMMPAAVSHAISNECGNLLTEDQQRDLANAVMLAVTREMASFCIDQNPRFDRQRFLGYVAGECGPNGGAVR